MFNIFTSPPPPKPFKPLLPSHPPSQPFSTQNRHAQHQSPIFSTLPPELRNIIYTHIFSYPSREHLDFPSLTPHPLSLLLTCHRIHTEASILAFTHFPFALNPRSPSTFLVFKTRLTHLPLHLSCTISVLSVTMPTVYKHTNITTFESAMALLPNLSRFEVRCEKDKKLWHIGLYPPEWLPFVGRKRWDERVETFAPHWFANGLVWECWRSRGLGWDCGRFTQEEQGRERRDADEMNEMKTRREEWEIIWPQLHPKYASYYETLVDIDELGEDRETQHIVPGAVGIMPGIEICPCGCGNIIFTTAQFVHTRTKRRITIDATFHGTPPIYLPLDAESTTRRMCGGNIRVMLCPGAPRLDVVTGDAGFGWMGSEEWWEERRRRSGDWEAWMRFAWNRLPGPGVLFGWREEVIEDIPGSFVLGQGDWKRIEEVDGREVECA